MKRLLFIYNPRAGKELLKPKLSDVIDIFVKAGYEVTVYPTQAHRDAYEKIVSYDWYEKLRLSEQVCDENLKLYLAKLVNTNQRELSMV